jgi:hypothetical protein|tara:strand:+ start:83 stop:520 length:438 start_codon:yes stop_codon:yes gene_type:complete
MTKWARMRRRKEKRRSEDKEGKLTNPEKITENIQHSQETEKADSTKTFTPRTIIAQIPRYSYLVAIFVLLAGAFFPLITPNISFDIVIQGTATLFLGLIGAILLFKAMTSDEKRGIFIVMGFALITVSLALIYYIQEHGYTQYFN